VGEIRLIVLVIIIIIIIIFIYCNLVVTRWQWLFNTNGYPGKLFFRLIV
jgi:hypothetical protein